ncbi:MAG: hypothetical protein ACRESV_01500, partial [Nevskiales bacterium]
GLDGGRRGIAMRGDTRRNLRVEIEIGEIQENLWPIEGGGGGRKRFSLKGDRFIFNTPENKSVPF